MMSNRIPTANVELDSHTCDRDATDCFFCTAKGKKAISDISSGLNARQRQLLILLAKSDSISHHASDKLLHKLPVKQMIEDGLLEQVSPCSEFCALLPEPEAMELIPDINNLFVGSTSNSNLDGIAANQEPFDNAELASDKPIGNLTRNDVLGVLDMLEKVRIRQLEHVDNDDDSADSHAQDSQSVQHHQPSQHPVDPMLQILSNGIN